MSTALYQMGKVEDGIAALRKVLEIDPNNKSARNNLTVMLERQEAAKKK